MQHLLIDISKGLRIVKEIHCEKDMIEAKRLSNSHVMIVQYESIEEGRRIVNEFNNKITGTPSKKRAPQKQTKSKVVAPKKDVIRWNTSNAINQTSIDKVIEHIKDDKWHLAFKFHKDNRLSDETYCCNAYRRNMAQNILWLTESKQVSLTENQIQLLNKYV